MDAKLFDALLTYGAARARALSDHEAQRIREIQPFVEREVATTRKSHANAEMVARAQADELRYGFQARFRSASFTGARSEPQRTHTHSPSFNFGTHQSTSAIFLHHVF